MACIFEIGRGYYYPHPDADVVELEDCYLRHYYPAKENTKRLVDALKTNDEAAFEKMLAESQKDGFKWSEVLPMLFVTVVFGGDRALVKRVIDAGCDVRDKDPDGGTAMHAAVWAKQKQQYYGRTRHWRRTETCVGCEQKIHRPDLVKLLLQSQSDPFDNVFLDANKHGVTPFILACAAGCDEIISIFLSLLSENKDHPRVDEAKFAINRHTIFHYLMESTTYYMPPTRVQTVRDLVEKVPNGEQLIKQGNYVDATPLNALLVHDIPPRLTKEMTDLTQLLLDYGVCPDACGHRMRGCVEPPICIAVVQEQDDEEEPPSILEALLRAGCRTDVHDPDRYTPLSLALKRKPKRERAAATTTAKKRPSIKIIELLLAFGVDLQKELYLYTIDERPIEYSSPALASARESSNVEPDILEALMQLRRSNTLLSLKRQCRNTIRRILKAKADAAIRGMENLPPLLKSYLLVEDETPILGISQ